MGDAVLDKCCFLLYMHVSELLHVVHRVRQRLELRLRIPGTADEEGVLRPLRLLGDDGGRQKKQQGKKAVHGGSTVTGVDEGNDDGGEFFGVIFGDLGDGCQRKMRATSSRPESHLTPRPPLRGGEGEQVNGSPLSEPDA